MATIILVRHGETRSNREQRVQGHRDSALTPKGVSQARRYGQTIRALVGAEPGWRVASSPLGRCAQTTGIICEIADLDFTTIAFDDRLKEIDAGSFSGLLKSELAARHPELMGGRGLDHWVFKSPDGESHAQLSARLAEWLASLAPDDKVVCVSHGIAGRVLRGLYLGLDPSQAMATESPQDALFVLKDGRIERVACAETP